MNETQRLLQKSFLGNSLLTIPKKELPMAKSLRPRRMEDHRIRHRILTAISAQKGRKFSMGPRDQECVYQIYGACVYFGVTSGRLVGKPEAILVRVLELAEGLGVMMSRRGVSQ